MSYLKISVICCISTAICFALLALIKLIVTREIALKLFNLV